MFYYQENKIETKVCKLNQESERKKIRSESFQRQFLIVLLLLILDQNNLKGLIDPPSIILCKV